MSEWFCRFFSPSLSKFTQTSCTFQARGVPAEKPVARGVPAEKPARSHGAPGEKPTYPRSSLAQRTHKKSPDAAQ